MDFPTLNGVRFVKIDGFDGYCVGNDGSVWSNYSGRWKRLRPMVTQRGYLHVRLYHGKQPGHKSIHQLVARAFVGAPPTENHEINHRDGVKANNTPENLEWVTRLENGQHAARMNLSPFGEKSGRAKLTKEQAVDIFVTRGVESTGVTAKKYNIERSTVQSIRRRETWRRATDGLSNA